MFYDTGGYNSSFLGPDEPKVSLADYCVKKISNTTPKCQTPSPPKK
jgi:hypothetical protein